MLLLGLDDVPSFNTDWRAILRVHSAKSYFGDFIFREDYIQDLHTFTQNANLCILFV